MKKEIVVGNWYDAKIFRSPQPYAMISFVSSSHHRSPPKVKRTMELRGRIVIRADDVLPRSMDCNGVPLPPELQQSQAVERFEVFAPAQADRIVRFVKKTAPNIDTLFVHCLFGQGRSAAAAIAIAQAYGLPWEHWTHYPYAPNPHILREVEAAFLRSASAKAAG